MMKDDEVVKKYDGKRIRINKCLYRIEVSVSTDITVTLRPMDPMADSASNHINRDKYGYEMGGATYRQAVDKAHEIAEEIEEKLEADIEA